MRDRIRHAVGTSVSHPAPAGCALLRWSAILLTTVGVLGPGARGLAQTTLLVRDEASVAHDAPTGAAEALRAATGASVRSLDASLEELALAAGCPEEPESPTCVASLAAAAGVQSLAIERTSRAAGAWRVTLDLRRGASGTRTARIEVSCASRADCIEALTLALSPTPAAAAAADPLRPHAPRGALEAEGPRRPQPETSHVVTVRASARVTTDVAPPVTEPARVVSAQRDAPMPVVTQVLVASTAVASVAAMIAGGVGVQLGRDAGAIGRAARPGIAERVAAIEASRDIAYGFGIALAITSACLATAALVLILTERSRGDAPALRLGGVIAPGAAMLSMEGRF